MVQRTGMPHGLQDVFRSITDPKYQNKSRKYRLSQKRFQKIQNQWDDAFLFQIYDCARSGMTNKEIAVALGFGYETYELIFARSKIVRLATRRGRVERKKIHKRDTNGKLVGKTAYEYIHEHLHPEVQKEWQDLFFAWKNQDFNAKEKLFNQIADKGTKHRQILFVQAYISTRFNASSAMAIVGVQKKELDKWQTQTQFQDLWNEIAVHRNAYFENKLFDLVDLGDSKATLFVNERLNRETYGKELKLTGQMEQQHTLKPDELDLTLLSPALQKAIYDELKAKSLLVGQHSDVIDVLPLPT
jgi:hypothetical protein